MKMDNWTPRFDETGGYDCMTGAWFVENGNDTICRIDQTDFGQKSGDYSFRSEDAEKAAKLISSAPKMLDLLKRADQLSDLPPALRAEIQALFGQLALPGAS